MKSYPHIASRVFNRPHLVEPSYGRVFIGALAERLDIRSLQLPDGTEMDRQALQRTAQAYEPGGRQRIFEEVDGIAVIPILGTLVHRYGHLDPYSGMTGYDGIQAKLQAAREDPSIRGILMDIDSPGGEVSGCFDLTDDIYETRREKPIWALVDELACSAAYSLASAASRIIVPRTAMTGSVGVLTAHVDHSQLLEGAGLDVTLIFAGEHKVDGNPYEPLPDDVRADIQAEIDDLYDMFTATVARNRGMQQRAVRDTEARVYTGADGVAVGFADEILAARDILPAFDEHLRGQRGTTMEVSRMNILGKLRGKKGKASASERLAELREMEAELEAEAAAEQAAEEEEAPESEAAAEPESEASGDGDGADAGDEAAADTGEEAGDQASAKATEPSPADEDQAATADRIVDMCAEANCDRLARGMIRDGVTVAQAKARIDNARQVRDAFTAAGFPHLAEKALDSGMQADMARALLTDVTAAASGEEIDSRQPTGQAAPAASLNVVDFYKRRNQGASK